VIHSLRKAYPIAVMCALAEVSRSSYYAFARPRAQRSRPVQLLDAVHQIHDESRASYGSRRMALALQSQGHAVGRYRARTLMKEAQLVVRKRRTHRYRKAEGEAHIASNLLDRKFEPGAINRVWAGDVTYVRSKQGWSYLAIVMDLHSRRIVGWAFDVQADTELVIQALQHAYRSRQPGAGLMFHSDQGCQYTSARFVDDLKNAGITQSMSRKANCWDNAVVERFFKSLKSEWIGEQEYESHEQAKSDIQDFVERYYNYQRIHSAANNLPPVLYEASFL
jgi:transposase InsO family protein